MQSGVMVLCTLHVKVGLMATALGDGPARTYRRHVGKVLVVQREHCVAHADHLRVAYR
jgi:hypothetical protein